jgi:hypothetical protein
VNLPGRLPVESFVHTKVLWSVYFLCGKEKLAVVIHHGFQCSDVRLRLKAERMDGRSKLIQKDLGEGRRSPVPH